MEFGINLIALLLVGLGFILIMYGFTERKGEITSIGCILTTVAMLFVIFINGYSVYKQQQVDEEALVLARSQ